MLNVNRKGRQVEVKRVSNIENLRFSKPKEFWKYFKTKDRNTDNGVDRMGDYTFTQEGG